MFKNIPPKPKSVLILSSSSLSNLKNFTSLFTYAEAIFSRSGVNNLSTPDGLRTLLNSEITRGNCV